MRNRSIAVMALRAVGVAVAAVLFFASGGPLGKSRRLGAGDCHPRKLTAIESCRGQDSSFQECLFYFRALGTPDLAWCRAALGATGRSEEPTACDFESPSKWGEVDCRRYGLAAFDRCFQCRTGELEASQTYTYGYDHGCTRAVEQVTCNVDPLEAGRLLDGQPPEKGEVGRDAAEGVAPAQGAPARSAPATSDAAPHPGLSAPEAVIERVIGRTTDCDPGRAVTRTCQVFEQYAVLATHDCDMGVKDLEVRARKGLAPAAVCAPRFAQRAALLDESFEPIGVAGRFLYAEWVDVFGALVDFRIDDLETGGRVLEDTRRRESPIVFQVTPAGLALDYWRALGGEPGRCTPTARDPGCWARTLARAAVAPGVPIPAPDCSAALARDPGAAVQLSVHVHLPRLSLPAAQYLPAAPACDLEP
jgi:hypothetical protein